GIKYPVALDNHLSTWLNYNNRFWPAHYLIDKTGKVVYTHFGEGDYDITENNIRNLLGLNKKEESKTEVPEASSGQTPETYLGYSRARGYAGVEPIQKDVAAHYSFPNFLPLNSWALSGKWQVSSDKITGMSYNSALQLNFKARKVFLVLSS